MTRLRYARLWDFYMILIIIVMRQVETTAAFDVTEVMTDDRGPGAGNRKQRTEYRKRE